MSAGGEYVVVMAVLTVILLTEYSTGEYVGMDELLICLMQCPPIAGSVDASGNPTERVPPYRRLCSWTAVMPVPPFVRGTTDTADMFLSVSLTTMLFGNAGAMHDTGIVFARMPDPSPRNSVAATAPSK
jgi:hypothetical protein